MRDIVETLETQHRALEKEASTLHQALTTADLAATRESLDRIATMLAAHVKLEHADFYPAFIKLADAAGPQKGQVVRLFEENLGRIAEGLTQFFKRWSGPLEASRLEALRTEWRTMLKLLASRLRDEETTLHPIWRSLSKPG